MCINKIITRVVLGNPHNWGKIMKSELELQQDFINPGWEHRIFEIKSNARNAGDCNGRSIFKRH